MAWTCDPELSETLERVLDRSDWAYVSVIDRSDMNAGEVTLGRFPSSEDTDDGELPERVERAISWVRGRFQARIAVADRKTALKLRVRAFGPKGINSPVSATFDLTFLPEAAPPAPATPLANEARELVGVMLDGVRGIVSTAGALMSQMGNQLLDERRQHADLQTRLATATGADQERQSRTAVANRFLDTLDGAVKAVAGEVHPVLANPKVRALLERADVQAALNDDATVDQVLQAVTFMAQSRQADAAPRKVARPSTPESPAVRALESELSRDRNLAVLLNTPEGTDALVETLRHLAAQPMESSDEPVPA